MVQIRQGVRRLATKVNPATWRVAVGPAGAKCRGGPAVSPAGECRDDATAIRDADRRQLLAMWWIVRLVSDAPEPGIEGRVAAAWRQASGSAPLCQRWRQRVEAVEAAVGEPARSTAWVMAGRGMVPRDRAALALILGGHGMADVAYLEQIPVRDVPRRLRTGLTSLGSVLLPTSREHDDRTSSGVAPTVGGPQPAPDIPTSGGRI